MERVQLVLPQRKQEMSRFVVNIRVNTSMDRQISVVPQRLCLYGTTVERIRNMFNEDSCP